MVDYVFRYVGPNFYYSFRCHAAVIMVSEAENSVLLEES